MKNNKIEINEIEELMNGIKKTKFEEIDDTHILIKSKNSSKQLGKFVLKHNGKFTWWLLSLNKGIFIGVSEVDDIRNKMKELNKRKLVKIKQKSDDDKWEKDATMGVFNYDP